MNTNSNHLTAAAYRDAAYIKEAIEALQVELDRLLAGRPYSGHKLGRFIRRHAAEAAALGAQGAIPQPLTDPVTLDVVVARKKLGRPRKSKFSPAARARLSALAKARWARARRAGKKTINGAD